MGCQCQELEPSKGQEALGWPQPLGLPQQPDTALGLALTAFFGRQLCFLPPHSLSGPETQSRKL